LVEVRRLAIGRRAVVRRRTAVVALRRGRSVAVALLRGRRTSVPALRRRGPVALGRTWRRGAVTAVLVLLVVAGRRARGSIVLVATIVIAAVTAILRVVLRRRAAVALAHTRRYEEAAVFAHDCYLYVWSPVVVFCFLSAGADPLDQPGCVRCAERLGERICKEEI
jgi:hypothetical protein